VLATRLAYAQLSQQLQQLQSLHLQLEELARKLLNVPLLLSGLGRLGKDVLLLLHRLNPLAKLHQLLLKHQHQLLGVLLLPKRGQLLWLLHQGHHEVMGAKLLHKPHLVETLRPLLVLHIPLPVPLLPVHPALFRPLLRPLLRPVVCIGGFLRAVKVKVSDVFGSFAYNRSRTISLSATDRVTMPY
jgi:hypothetical protein